MSQEKILDLNEFIQNPNDCSELFKIWDSQRSNPSLKSIGTIIIRRIIRNYMKTIDRNLSSDRLPLCQSTLRLLIMMNSHDISTTRELQETFHFNLKVFSKLVNIRRKDSQNISRQMQQDETKNFANLIFKGLSQDNYEFVEEIFQTFYNYIILDNKIGIKSKLAFFNRGLLNQLLNLYSRSETDLPESNKFITDLVHKFLLSICCTPGVGICFQDEGWYPYVHNRLLSYFIKSLKPTQHLKQQELLLKILETCPELIPIFLQSATLLLEPSLSYKWLANITLLQKIIALPVPAFYIPGTTQYPNITPEISTIMQNILPQMLDRVILNKCLNHNSNLVKYKILVLLCSALQKFGNVIKSFRKIIEELESDKTLALSSPPLLISEKWKETINCLFEELKCRMPDIQILLRMYNRTSATDNNYLPEAVIESKFDLGKLIPGNLVEAPLIFQIHFLELLLLVPDFNWLNKVPMDYKNNSSLLSFSHLTTIIDLFITTPYSGVSLAAKRVIDYFLEKSILFKHDPTEISFWLKSLQMLTINTGSTSKGDYNDMFKTKQIVLQFLDNCIIKYLKDPFPYIDEISQLSNELKDRYLQNVSRKIFSALISKKIPCYFYPFSPLFIVLVKEYEDLKDDNHLLPITHFLHNLFKSLLWKQPLPGYLYFYVKKLKGNGSESFFDYKDIVSLLDVIDKKILDNTEFLSPMLKSTPFSILLSNSIHKLKKPSVSHILIKSLQSTPLIELFNATRQILLLIGCILMILVRSTEGLDQKNSDIREEGDDDRCSNVLKDSLNLIVGWPVFDELFLLREVENLKENQVLIKLLDALDEFVADLVEYFTDKKNIIKHKKYDINRSNDLSKFKIKLLNLVSFATKKNNQSKKKYFTKLLSDDKFIYLIDKFSEFWEKGELVDLLENILNIDRSTISFISNSGYLNRYYRILLIVFNKLYNHHQSTASIIKLSDNLYQKLIFMWKNYPSSFSSSHSSELDLIFLQIVESYMPPGLTPSSSSSLEHLNLLQKNNNYKRLIGELPKQIDIEVVKYILSDLNTTTRTKILSYLIMRKAEFLDVSLLLTYVLEIVSSTTSSTTITWSNLATDHDKKAIKILSKQYSLIFFKKLTSSSNSGEISLNSKNSLHYVNIINSLLSLSPDNELIKTLNQIIDNYSTIEFNLNQLTIIEYYLNCDGNIDNFTINQLRKFIMDCLHHATLFLEKDKYKEYDGDEQGILVGGIFTKIESLIKLIIPKVKNLDANIIGEFIFVLLEKRFEDFVILNCVRNLIVCEYRKESNVLGPPLDKILEAIFNNPKFKHFTTTPLPEDDNYHDDEAVRLSIFYLINKIFHIDPKNCCKPDYLDLLFTYYGATTSLVDQLLLDIYILYEKITKLSIVSSAMYWGPGSNRQMSRQKLMGQRVLVETLGLIDPKIMIYSYTHFPIDKDLSITFEKEELMTVIENELKEVTGRKYVGGTANNSNRNIIKIQNPKLAPTYDPSFFLPLFANLISSYGNLLDFRKLLEINALGFIVVSLSSNNENIRKDIPMFYNLFYSSSDNYQKERVWLLRLLSAGLKTNEDYKIFKRRHAWDIISGYYNSSLTDNITKKIIIEILFQASSISQVITDMVKNKCLITWIHNLCVSSLTMGKNSSSIFGLRILLRVLQGCKNSILQKSNGVLVNQVIFILTGLLKSLDLLYVLDDDYIKMYKQIIRILFELTFSNNRANIIGGDKGKGESDQELINKIIVRTLVTGVAKEARFLEGSSWGQLPLVKVV
ncbi:7056_t:CDS:10 [Entrophospora sp. SA101]|nr:7056_t:CDS:10 [Entrophospora sp. SA101]